MSVDKREESVKDWLESLSNSESLDSYNDKRLAYGALIVENMRKAVREKTGFHCSAGISHNKVCVVLTLVYYVDHTYPISTLE